jgi:predicted phage tail protein
VKPCPPRKSAYHSVAGLLRLVLQAAVLGAFWAAGMLWLAALYLVAMIASIAATETCARLLERR